MDAWVQRPFPFVHCIFLYKQKLPVKAAAAESQNRCGVGSSRFLTQTSPGYSRKACGETASISICCRSLPCMTVLQYSSLWDLWCWTEAITVCLRWLGLSSLPGSLMEIFQRIDWNSTQVLPENFVQQGGLRAQTLPRQVKFEAQRALNNTPLGSQWSQWSKHRHANHFKCRPTRCIAFNRQMSPRNQ